MHSLVRMLSGVAAVAVLGAVVVGETVQPARAQGAPGAQAQGGQPAGPPQKKLKDQGEYDVYNDVIKDIAGSNFAKAVADLDAWKQKYPDSDYKDDQLYFYIQAYHGANQPAKVLDIASELLSKDLKTAFPDQKQQLQVLYPVAFNAAKIADANSTVALTPEERATGDRAARQLAEFAASYFGSANKPPGTSEADWSKARTQVESVAKAAAVALAMVPGNAAMKANAKDPANCAKAEPAYARALQDYPDSSQAAWALAGALRCQQVQHPDKVPAAIYEYARAAAIDPTLGGTARDPKAIQTYASQVYTAYHGSDEGFAQLKEMAAKSPLPPPDFKLASATDIAREKEAQFEKSNPQLAMWMKVKGQLADSGGQQYFDSQLKDAAVPKLKGTLVEAKPACRPKELLVAIPEPDQQGTLRPEITLKLDDALTGKPETGSEIEWEGVPSAFSREPFMLTMDTGKDKIQGLKEERCGPAAPPAKKGAAKKQ